MKKEDMMMLGAVLMIEDYLNRNEFYAKQSEIHTDPVKVAPSAEIRRMLNEIKQAVKNED